MSKSDVTAGASVPPEEAHLFEMQAVPPTRKYLARMWRQREFVIALPAEELRASHQATLLGNLWHLGNPVLSVFVYYIIFGVLLGVSRGIDNFTLFLVVGVFVYQLTSKTVTGGARSIAANAGLMRAIRFPRAILPLSVVMSNLYTFGFQLVILGGVALATGEGIGRRWLALPLVILLQSVFNLGGALIAARLNDMARDVEQIIPFVMRLGMYGSGVMFSIHDRIDEAPEWAHVFVTWNPLVTVLDTYRWVFLGTTVEGDAVVRLAIISVVLLVLGFRFFVGAESRYGRG